MNNNLTKILAVNFVLLIVAINPTRIITELDFQMNKPSIQGEKVNKDTK